MKKEQKMLNKILLLKNLERFKMLSFKKIILLLFFPAFPFSCKSDSSNKTNLLLALLLLNQQKAATSSSTCGYYATVSSGTVNFNAALNTPSTTSTSLVFASTGGGAPAAIVKVTLAASQKLTFTTTTSKIYDFNTKYYSGNQSCPINATPASSTVLTTSGDLVNTYSYGATSSNAGTYTFVIYNASFLVTSPTDFMVQIQ